MCYYIPRLELFVLMSDMNDDHLIRLPRKCVKNLRTGMTFLHISIRMSQSLMRFTMLGLPMFDIIFKINQITIGTFGLIIFWNIILAIALHQMTACAMLMAQQTCFFALYFQRRFLLIRSKLIHIFHMNHVNRLIGRNRRWINLGRMQKVFRELIGSMHRYMVIRTQYKWMAPIAYYTINCYIELFLYLSFDDRSSPLIRTIAIIGVGFIGGSAYIAFVFMCEVNSNSKRLIPKLNHYLFRTNHPTNISRKLFLSETKQLIADNAISVNMGDIFQMTRLVLVYSVFNLMQNVFLIIELNRIDFKHNSNLNSFIP